MSDPGAGVPQDEREQWAQLARGWERHADFVARQDTKVLDWIVSHLDPKPGETFLELGAGPGDTGFAVAEKLGTDGKLISTDVSPDMLGVTQRRAQQKGATNVEFKVTDAQAIDFPDASVDGALYRYGPMLLDDPGAHAREVRRVLKDGGRYATAVIGPPDVNLWMTVPMMSFIQSGFPPPVANLDPTAPGSPFSLADPDRLNALFLGAGFKDVVVEPIEQPFTFESFDEVFTMASELAGPLAIAIGTLSDDDKERYKETLRGNVEGFKSGDGYALPAKSLVALAR